MKLGLAAGCMAALFIAGCADVGADYFRQEIDVATLEMVGERYGAPHNQQVQENGNIVWTYFDRGSGTSSYGGRVTSAYCRAHVLTFDKRHVLTAWQVNRCQS